MSDAIILENPEVCDTDTSYFKPETSLNSALVPISGDVFQEASLDYIPNIVADGADPNSDSGVPVGPANQAMEETDDIMLEQSPVVYHENGPTSRALGMSFVDVDVMDSSEEKGDGTGRGEGSSDVGTEQQVETQRGEEEAVAGGYAEGLDSGAAASAPLARDTDLFSSIPASTSEPQPATDTNAIKVVDASSLFGGPAAQSEDIIPSDAASRSPPSAASEPKAINNLSLRASSSSPDLNVPGVIPKLNVKDASSLFSSADTLFFSPASSSFDSFPPAPPFSSHHHLTSGTTAPCSVFSAPPPGSKAPINPSDVFDFAAPVSLPVAPVNPLAPPSAPGVKAVFLPAPSLGSLAPAAAAPGAGPVNKKPIVAMAPAPPGAIATPHGYVTQPVPRPAPAPATTTAYQAYPMLPSETRINTSAPVVMPLTVHGPSSVLYPTPLPAAPAAAWDPVVEACSSQVAGPVPLPTAAVQQIPTPYGAAKTHSIPTPYGFASPPSSEASSSSQGLQQSSGYVSGLPYASSAPSPGRSNTRYSRPTTAFATFGFGGRVLVFNSNPATTGLSRT